MQKRWYFLFLLFIIYPTFSQNKDSIYFKNGIENPTLQPTHHFGIFSSRINQNFKLRPSINREIRLSTESGNSFQPFVEAYLPKDQNIRNDFSTKIWYNRQFDFIDQVSTPSEYMNIIIDAVIKGFHLDFTIPFSKTHELTISIRSYLLTKGKYPFSIFTSDEFIEWFHSNIAGGEDPFGRKYYGINQVHFKYTDRNGKILVLNNGAFFVGNLQLNHHFYPKLLWNKKKNIFINFGSHFGINTSQYNTSLDIGVSANLVKKFKFKNHNEIHFGIGGSILRKNLINFKDVVELGNNKYLARIETEIEFTKFTLKKNYNSFGLHYQLHTRYNKLKEASYLHLKGKWNAINAGWHHGFTTLYEGLSAFSFVYTYGNPKYKLTLYLNEDFKVNNAPDAQTGISILIPF